MAVIIKSAQEIAVMRKAGQVVAAVLDLLAREAKAGVTTLALDEMAESEIRRKGGIPSFKGYRGFPGSICTSINEEVVHGIPAGRALKDGDIVKLDVGVILEGFQGDAGITVAVGKVSDEARKLISTAEGALKAGIGAARPGARIGDVSAAIQGFAESRGFSVVREYVGHGIGRSMHEDPQIPNFGIAGQGPLLHKGMTIALEPMLNVGTWRTRLTRNGWTVVTADGKLSAYSEHTIAIDDDGAQILTIL